MHDPRAFLRLNIADIRRRHCVADACLQIDCAGVTRDVLGSFQNHAFRSPSQVAPAGLGRMAHGAAAQHDVGHIIKAFGCGKALRNWSEDRIFTLSHIGGRHRQPDDHCEDCPCRAPCPPQFAAASVHGVEEMPDYRSHQKHKRCYQPVPLAGEGQRVVVRQHQEQYRQDQIIVVGGPLLGASAVFCVRLAARLQIGHDDRLIWNDDQEYIRRHDRRSGRSQMKQRRTALKDLGIAPGHGRQRGEENDHKQGVAAAERGLADSVIDQPGKAQ